MLVNLLSTEPVYFADTLEPISLWLTVGFIGAIALTLIISLIINKSILGQVAKCSLISLLFYSLALGIVLLIAEISKKFSSGYLDDNWVNSDVVTHVLLPLLICLSLSLVGGIALFILSRKHCKAKRTFSIIFSCLLAISVVVTLVLMSIHYSKNIVDDGYYTSPDSNFNSTLLYLFSVLLILLVVALAFIVGRKNKAPFTSKTISFAGICLAISFTLSFIKFETAWLQGGSITLASFLPICLFAYVYGMKKGLLVGFVYGLLQAVQDPFIVHPAQFLLDYPIAFCMIALSGLLTDLNLLNKTPRLKFALGASITGLFRYFAHVISGVFAFGAYALDAGANSFFVYSAIYNTYVFFDIALAIIVGVVILSSKGFNKELDKLREF